MTTATTTDAAAAGNQVFLRNIQALAQVDPALAREVSAVAEQDRYPLVKTKSGDWTVQVPMPTGAPAYLHSRYDPMGEGERLAAAVPIENKFCFVVSGLGLGYHVKALFDRLRGDIFIVCVEPSIRLVATALACLDLHDVIASGRFCFLTSDDKARLHQRLHPQSALIMLGAQFVPHQPSVKLAPELHASITTAIAEFVSFARMSLTTLMANSRITCQNIAMNMANYVSTPPIDMLRNRFAGDPAVVIAAGPSLSRNIDQLAGLKGKAVLCAVQTVLQPLARHGIVPDFVTSLDFHEMSRKFFHGVDGLDKVHLVAEPKATWHVVDEYPGPISLLDNYWAHLVLGEPLAARDGLTAGATVAHLAFYLSVYMGCDPIIFVGQDLAFTGNVFYVPGVEIHRTWRGEMNRFCSIEQKEWERIARNRPILRKVKGAGGEQLFADDLLFTYLEQFEKDISKVSCKVIDATEGGAQINGAQAMPLDEVARRYCHSPIDPARFAYLRETQWRSDRQLPATRDELQVRLAELQEVDEVCEELLDLLAELKDLTHNADKFNRRLERVDELRAKIHQESRAYRIVNASTQLVEFRRFRADRVLSLLKTDDADRAQRQIERDVAFIGGVRDGALEVVPMLEVALERVEERLANS